MSGNIQNVITIAQKEFADTLWNPIFIVLLITFSLVTIACVYQYEIIEAYSAGELTDLSLGISRGVWLFSHIMGQFIPLFGIALSFDTLLKEEKSGSLNVLLTHPVYRDNIITGKILGSMLSLLLVLFISTTLSIGISMMIIGETVTIIDLIRICIIFLLTYLYAVVFLGIGLIISTVVKDSSDSLVYNVVLWLIFTVAFMYIIPAFVLISGLSFTEDGGGLALFTRISSLSPLYHYQQLMTGIIDPNYTFSQIFAKYWMNLAVLIVTPIILFVLSVIAFLRKDITL
jgi:ABC-2 type transport system permease protein